MKKLSIHARFCTKYDLTVCNNKYFAGSIIGQDIENNVMISLACSINYRLHSKHRLVFHINQSQYGTYCKYAKFGIFQRL